MNLDEVIFEPKATQEHIKQGMDWLVNERRYFSGVASFCVIGEDGNLREVPHGSCHNQIANEENPQKRVLVATCNGQTRSNYGVKKSEIEPFLRWFLYESYFGRFILNRDDYKFCRDHGFIVSADVYTPLMQNVLITTRHFKECTREAFLKFNELIEKGANPELAYVVCFCTTWSCTKLELNMGIKEYSGHRAHTLFDLTDLKRFLDREMYANAEVVNDPRLHYRNYLKYVGGQALFRKSATQNASLPATLIASSEAFRKALSAYRHDGGAAEMYKPPNPFARQVPGTLPGPGEISYEELFEVVVPFLTENKEWRS